MAAGNSLETAILWFEQLFFGRLSNAVAVLAIGFAGFRMLEGYADAKVMARVMLGCFILFGAPSLANAFLGGTETSDAVISSDVSAPAAAVSPAPSISAPAMPPATINPFDPYVGGGQGR